VSATSETRERGIEHHAAGTSLQRKSPDGGTVPSGHAPQFSLAGSIEARFYDAEQFLESQPTVKNSLTVTGNFSSLRSRENGWQLHDQHGTNSEFFQFALYRAILIHHTPVFRYQSVTFTLKLLQLFEQFRFSEQFPCWVSGNDLETGGLSFLLWHNAPHLAGRSIEPRFYDAERLLQSQLTVNSWRDHLAPEQYSLFSTPCGA
jgi:hypothetical protein